MIEVDRNFASKGVAGTALGLGAGALGLELLRGGLGGILGNNGCCNTGCNTGCSENIAVNRYEAAKDARIAELETEIKLRDANAYTIGEINKVRDYVDRRLDSVTASINQQAVYNATNNAALGCLQGQVAQLMGLTRLVVPNGSICPGWGDVTVSVTPATTT